MRGTVDRAAAAAQTIAGAAAAAQTIDGAAAAAQTVDVAAAALLDAGDQVLMARRPEGKSLAGLWEFPGGKIEPGESPEQALVRELFEELGIRVAIADLRPLTVIRHPYADFTLVMTVHSCRTWTGTAHGREGQAVAWTSLADLAALPMPPADLPVVAALAALLGAPRGSD